MERRLAPVQSSDESFRKVLILGEQRLRGSEAVLVRDLIVRSLQSQNYEVVDTADGTDTVPGPALVDRIGRIFVPTPV